jgi:hypothetical protein
MFLLLSIAVNGAFVTAWLTHTVPAATPCSGGQETCCVLLQTVGATDAQRQEMEPRLAEFRKASQAQCREINCLRAELIDLIADAQPDPQAIHVKQMEILGGQRKMQELVVEQLLAAKSVLTPEQQKAMFNLIRTECGCSGSEGELGCTDPEVDCCKCLQDCPGDRILRALPRRRSS